MSADTLTADGGPIVLAAPSGFTATGFAALQGVDAVVVAYQGASSDRVVEYALTGAQIASTAITSVDGPVSVAAIGGSGGGYVATWGDPVGPPRAGPSVFFKEFDSGGGSNGAIFFGGSLGPTAAFTMPNGYHVEWNSGGPNQTYVYTADDVTNAVQLPTHGSSGYVPQELLPYANVQLGSGQDVIVTDNHILVNGQSTATLPGEPDHAVTDVAAAALLGGATAAIGWVDSGTDYVTPYNAGLNTFGPTIGLDWGGASNLHMVALPDGGFVVSWENGGAYKGEVFDAVGNGGGIIALAGDVAGIDSHGDLYTVGLNTSGDEVIQTYAINGGSSGAGGGGGGTTGQTFNSDNNGDVWTGTAGDDTFDLGRGGDWVTGNGGNDTYRFAAIPWAGGGITDFNAGDTLDLRGLMSTTADTGTDGVADGFLKVTDDGAGDAQVWARYATSGDNSNWWLVDTLDGVSSSSLQHAGDVFSLGGSSGGGGTTGQTFTSDDNGDVWVGTAGNDVFHLGRGGDWVTGGAGADTFAYAAIPWAAGGITDFNAAEGDRIDVTGLLSQASYTGSDPFADGYLKFAADGSGNAQVWAEYGPADSHGWWLVATLDGVSTSSLHYSGGLIT